MKLETNRINIFLLFVIVYFMTIRRYTNADEILIFLLGCGVIVERIKNKNYFKVNKSLVFIVLLSLILMLLNYYKLSQITDLKVDNIENRQHRELFNLILLKYFLFGGILSQINLNLRIKRLLLFFISICSLYIIIKGINYGIEYSFNSRCDLIWRNPNYLSMMLGIFSIVSFISVLEIQKIYLKIIFIIIGISHLFLIVTIGQSRNVFIALFFTCFFSILLFLKKYCRQINLKKLFKISCIVIIVAIVIFYFFKDLRILNILNIETIKNDGRVILLKKAKEILLNDNITFLTGKGFAYYIIEKITLGTVEVGTFHNDILELIITQGFLAGIAYTLFFILNLLIFLKEYFRKNDNIYLLVVLLLVYTFFIGIFDNAVYSDRVLQFLILFLFLNIPKKIIKY